MFDKRVPPQTNQALAFSLLLDMAMGLAYLHGEGIVHGGAGLLTTQHHALSPVLRGLLDMPAGY